MRLRIATPFVLAVLMAAPALAQEARTTVPVIPAPTAQTAPQATDTRLQSQPATVTPARKSNCARSKQVMS